MNAASTPAGAARPVTAQGDRDLEVAGRVLRLESDALRALAQGLDRGFLDALGTMAAVTGRVAVSDMGKSGHVARKIASTLASTGTPSFYVHPGEASHGDLGMIAPGDAVLALSNSGETAELSDLIAYTRRYDIPLISITGKAASTLSEASDVAIVLPEAPEACPMGLAPTTSTTLMLALGDALAVTLLERKGFTAKDFHVLHPGGQLGRRLVLVSDIMHQGEALPLASPDTSMADALLEMTAKSFGCVGIVGEDGALDGVITDGDLRRHIGNDLLGQTTGVVMSRCPKTIRPSALAAEAVSLMNASKITNLFVVDDGRPVGILHLHDCLRAGVV